jgi:histidinol-phosphate/aromatic aminotransferase/cobyric acid decarboxylase-like protein
MSKPLPPRPELERKLRESAEAFERLPRDEKEKILRTQRESWARQDKD